MSFRKTDEAKVVEYFTWCLLYVHELDVLCEVMQQRLAIPLSVGMEDTGEGEGDLSVHRRLC